MDKRVENEILYRFREESLLNIVKSPILCIGARLGGEVRAFKKLGFTDTIGIDFNPGSNNPDVVFGDAMNLKYGNNSFRTIYTNILGHVLDLKKVFSDP